MCVLILLQLLSQIFLILTRIHQDTIDSIYWSSRNIPFIHVRFEWNLNFFNIFSKNTQISNFIKICPVGAKLFHTDRQTKGQTNMTKLIVTSHNLVNTPKNELLKQTNFLHSKFKSKKIWHYSCGSFGRTSNM